MPTRIPKDHPRRRSLLVRERMKDALKRGIIHETGLIAHGRGEAFDYLLGEHTGASARRAIQAAAALLAHAQRPVVCANGNAVALAPEGLARVAKAARARLEVNLFHRSEARVRRLVKELERHGATDVLGAKPNARIPGLASDRSKSHRDGSFGADVVLVPLEDGDRAEALVKMGKTIIAIDLNPLSRTAQAAHVTIVDEVTRALPLLAQAIKSRPAPLRRPFNNGANLRAALREMRTRLAHA